MKDDDEVVGVEFELLVDAGEFTATEADWPRWEQQRSRYFFNSDVRQIDSGGQLGQIRNRELKLEKSRAGDGFSATYVFAYEENIGPQHLIARDMGEVRLKDVSGTYLIVFTAEGFAADCGGWRRREYSGALDPQHFERMYSLEIASRTNSRMRRC